MTMEEAKVSDIWNWFKLSIKDGNLIILLDIESELEIPMEIIRDDCDFDMSVVGEMWKDRCVIDFNDLAAVLPHKITDFMSNHSA